jgi:hypothetical protein
VAPVVVGVTLLVAAAAQAQVEVKTVPWVPTNPLIPHDTWSGEPITLKGTTNVTSGIWTWDFGDGSPVATGPIEAANRYWLQATHSYTGAPGTVHTARLIVASGEETVIAYYYVAIQAKTLAVEANVAIDEGLWYLHRSMYRHETGGPPLGNWTQCTGAASDCRFATSTFYGLT